jgi:hypothetical protein
MPYGGWMPLPTQLHFYPSQWHDVLEAAKWKFHQWLTLDCPFPDRTLISEAKGCIDKSIVEHGEKGGSIEDGMFACHLNWINSSFLTGHFEPHACHMRNLVCLHQSTFVHINIVFMGRFGKMAPHFMVI